MIKRVAGILMVFVVAVFTGGGVVLARDDRGLQDHQKSGTAPLAELRELPSTVAQVKSPEIQDPQWLKDKQAAERQVAAPKPQAALAGSRTINYSVEAWGNLRVDAADFKAKALATLNDGRGWSRAGVKFAEVPAGGAFTLVISEAAELERRYAPGCSAAYSCRVGRFVIINQDRWLGATPTWNAAGGGLREYQHMVINHEIGHWLGHGHPTCTTPGAPAPVMLQQSIDLQGCTFNPWPLENELWVRI